MKLSAPKTVVWVIAVIIGVVGILAFFIGGPDHQLIFTWDMFWLPTIGFVVLALATLLKGL